MLRDTYNTRGISEHLGDRNVYQPLTCAEANRIQSKLCSDVLSFAAKWRARRAISKAETVYLQRSVDRGDSTLPTGEPKPYQFARFRMSLKAHKAPWKMRPIVCCAGTFMNSLSCWLDYWLQKLKPFVPMYLRDSHDLLDKLRELGPLPPDAKLFTADANSMYTNIDTDHAIDVISLWLDSLRGQLPDRFPLDAVKEAMSLVMRNNVFEWGDCYFLQLLGTAMGTSAACMWATIYFAVHEAGHLIPTYDQHLLVFLRFIDDIFGIWIDANDATAWDAFKADTNNFGILTWEFEEPSNSVDFLDLTISIENNSIVTKTYQKAMNLYQYIPPTSAHPPGMMKGIIYGLLRNYKLQNTRESDYLDMAELLFRRHVARGWSKAIMKEYILSADMKLRNPTPKPATPTNDARLFLHTEYHPNDLPKHELRTLYNVHCKDVFESTLGIDQVTVAYSRPKNIKDMVTKAKLHQAEGREASKFYSGELP